MAASVIDRIRALLVTPADPVRAMLTVPVVGQLTTAHLVTLHGLARRVALAHPTSQADADVIGLFMAAVRIHELTTIMVAWAHRAPDLEALMEGYGQGFEQVGCRAAIREIIAELQRVEGAGH